MSSRQERLEQIERDVREAKASTGHLDGRKMLADFEYLLGLTAQAPKSATGSTSEPRVWRGDTVNVSHWWWMPHTKAWEMTFSIPLRDGDTFVAGCYPRPNAAPPDDVIRACSSVDWEG